MKGRLRPYQVEALAKIRAFLGESPSRQLVVMATGTGKTVVKAHALRECRAMFGPSTKALILVHREEVAQQVMTRFQEHVPEARLGLEKGTARASRDADVVVASVQSVGRASSRRLEWLNPKLVLVDEAHHATAETWHRAIDRIGGDAHVLGFTATPHRSGEPLFGNDGAIFDSVIYTYDLRTGISEGFLSELRGWLVTTDLDVSQVRIHARDFEGRDLQKVVDTDTRTAIAFKAWRERAGDRQTIAFCAGVDHAAHVAEFFRAHGVQAASLTAEASDRERRRLLEEYRRGAIQVIANVGILTEGYDSPTTSCVLMLRPTKSWTLYTQMVGRGTRPSSGKRNCIVLDVVDVTGKHDVCTLPALAKLPQRTQLGGRTVSEAFDLAEELEGLEAVQGFEGDVKRPPGYPGRDLGPAG